MDEEIASGFDRLRDLLEAKPSSDRMVQEAAIVALGLLRVFVNDINRIANAQERLASTVRADA